MNKSDHLSIYNHDLSIHTDDSSFDDAVQSRKFSPNFDNYFEDATLNVLIPFLSDNRGRDCMQT